MFTTGLFIIAKKWKQFECSSTDKWINESGIFKQWNYNRAIQRTQVLVYATTWINFKTLC